MKAKDVEPEIDRLYGLPLAEFVDARNELARRLRAAGERQAAAAVKRLTKPSVTAWAVNALVHHEGGLFAELLTAAAAVRAALGGKGDRVAADRRRRQALRSLLKAAERRLAAAGHAVTPGSRQQISHTLEALAAREPGDGDPPPGRLTRDLEAPGFDALAGLAASLAPATAGRPTPPAKQASGRKAAGAKATAGRRSPGKDTAVTARERHRQKARQEVSERQAEVDRATGTLEAADAAVAAAVERQRRLAADAAEAEERARLAGEAAAQAEKAVGGARAEAARARASLRRAASRLESARRKLERL